jgi:uncharacterized protein
LRAVFDTNTVVSALVFQKGRLAWLREVWRSAAVTPLASQATARELLRVLGYPKFKLTNAERDELLSDYLPFAEIVTVPPHMPKLPRCRDAADQMFIKLAVAGKAALLITGDDNLLAMVEEVTFDIVSPTRLHDRL